MDEIARGQTIPELLARRAATDASARFCQFGDEDLSIGQLAVRVARLASGLHALGIEPGDRVGVMLANHPDHIVTMLAVIKSGAIWVPINAQLTGASLRHVIEHADPRAIIADAAFRERLNPVLQSRPPEFVIWRGIQPPLSPTEIAFDRLLESTPPVTSPTIAPDDVVCISYTSGTTGAPKGVQVTDRMLRAAAIGARLGGDIRDGDVLLLWEPLYHIGGSQVVVLALMQAIRLVLVERFSASRFWDQARRGQVTHIHHLGGILHILLKQPESERDRDHGVRITWGGGCSRDVWEAVEQRFGVQVRELYGMTEASSISVANGAASRMGSIGKPLPYFAVRVVDDDGADCLPGALGEIIMRGQMPGLITPGYFRSPDATAAAIRDGWLYSGDLARVDEDGFLTYCGRKTDSVRYRGENISAWEVERVINEHPDVEESALIGVETDIGEQDLKVFIKLAAERTLQPEALIRWCHGRLPRFQLPRYVSVVDEFEKTSTLRIKKESLSRSTFDCWDRERSAIE